MPLPCSVRTDYGTEYALCCASVCNVLPTLLLTGTAVATTAAETNVILTEPSACLRLCFCPAATQSVLRSYSGKRAVFIPPALWVLLFGCRVVLVKAAASNHIQVGACKTCFYEVC
jgi:hypothetical protein